MPSALDDAILADNIAQILKYSIYGAGAGTGLAFLSQLSKVLLSDKIDREINKVINATNTQVDLDLGDKKNKKLKEKKAFINSLFNILSPETQSLLNVASLILSIGGSYSLVKNLLKEYNKAQIKNKINKSRKEFDKSLQELWQAKKEKTNPSEQLDNFMDKYAASSNSSWYDFIPARDTYWQAVLATTLISAFLTHEFIKKKLGIEATTEALKRYTAKKTEKYHPEIFVDLPDKDDTTKNIVL